MDRVGSSRREMCEMAETSIHVTGKERRKAVTAAAMGNLVEWFDFGVYGYFASILAVNFFVSESHIVSLMATFATFAVGFFMRPLGAIVIGAYGDRAGRKKALAFTVIMMAVATFIIGILPTYHQIGLWAPFLLVLARLAQGFSAGGEWGGSASFMVEYADESSKGFWGSWQQVSTSGGLFLGSLSGLILSHAMSADALESWGWRVPFIIGGILGLIGLYLRTKVEETPEFEAVEESGEVSKAPLVDTLRNYHKEVLTGFGFTTFWTVSYYGLLTYTPAFISDIVGLSQQQSFLANSLALIVLLILIPVAGHLSDRYGRKPLLLFATIGGIILTYPLYLMMATGSFGLVLIAEIIFSILIASFSGAGVAAITEIFPTKVRYSALSIGYNFAIAVFGGTAPFISTYLINMTGSNVSPAIYIILAAIVTTLVVWRINFNRFREEPALAKEV